MPNKVFIVDEPVSGDTIQFVVRGSLPQTISGLAAGDYTILNTLAQATVTVTSAPSTFINDGMDPAISNIMVEGESQSAAFLFDVWNSGGANREAHEWSQVFRSEYTGDFFGATGTSGGAVLTGGMPGMGNGSIIGPGNGTETHWLYGSYPAGNDPRYNLADFDALIIWERSRDDREYKLADPYAWTDAVVQRASFSDLRGEWNYAQAAAQAGHDRVFLAIGHAPMLEDGATGADGIRTEWRENQLSYNVPARARQQYLQHRLNEAGHTDMQVFMIPFHVMALRMHDDIMNSAPELPATITSFYDYAAVDTGHTGNNGYHNYMRSVLGAYADWCLTYAVVFATSPVGLPNSSTNFSITPEEAAYLQNMAWEIAQDYYPTGLGGTTDDEVVWERYQGETFDALLPASSTQIDVLSDQKYSDIAGTTAAVEGGLVGRIGTYAAMSEGARPTLNQDHLTLSDDPIAATVTGLAPNYGFIVTSLNNEMAGVEFILGASGGSGSFSIRADLNNQYFGSLISVDYEGGWSFCGVPPAYFDGRKILIEWQLRPNGETTSIIISDLDAPLEDGEKHRVQLLTDRTLANTRTTFAVGPNPEGEPADLALYAMGVSSEAPSDLDRLKIRARIYEEFGGITHLPDFFG